LLGFEVADVKSGKVIHRVVAKTPASRPTERQTDHQGLAAQHPDHGINITPDQKEVWVVDGKNGYVFVYDVTRMPPVHVADVPLFATSQEQPKPGWLSFSIEGDYAYPSCCGAIDTRTRRLVDRFETSEKLLEVQFVGGKPVKAGHASLATMRRRGFLKKMVAGAAAPLAAQLPQAASSSKAMVALQLDSRRVGGRGHRSSVLDVVQERAAVNTLLVDSLWFSRGTTEAELQGDRNRGHGKRAADSRFRGSGMGTVHPQYYRDIGVDPGHLMPRNAEPGPAAGAPPCCSQARDPAGLPDQGLLPRQAAGVESWSSRISTASKPARPARGTRSIGTWCWRGGGPDPLLRRGRDHVHGRAPGAFTDTLGLRFRGVSRGLPGSRTCFCRFCQQKAREGGIDFSRAKAGFEELEKFVAAGRAGRRPVDGYYVTLWRLMLRFPELLAWEHLWHEGLRELLKEMHAKVKATRDSVLFGSHIWPNHYMNPILRAETDLASWSVPRFHQGRPLQQCGGPRFGSYIDSVSQTMWGDVPRGELLQLHYRLMNYDEAPYERVRQAGLKGDFVYRESKRAMEGARGSRTLILAGIDVDIPVLSLDLGPFKPTEVSKGTRQDVKQAVMQAFRGGVNGIVVSREYTEMTLENLSGVGDAIRELGLKA
jgi:hypothetical protein